MLLIVHNLDIKGARSAEQEDFDHAIDFKEIYRPLENSRSFTRLLDRPPGRQQGPPCGCVSCASSTAAEEEVARRPGPGRPSSRA